MYYRSLNAYLRETFGCKVYKLALSAGCTCPNRDGTIGTRGCIFCSGSGEFAASASLSIPEQLAQAKRLVAAKAGPDARYIAYFQDFTNTYAPAEVLRPLFAAAIRQPEVCALSIATRPDCLPPEILSLLAELRAEKPVWVELGLQTIHASTAAYIRRGYPLSVYDEAVRALHARGISVITHQILGLPGETPEMMVETARYIGRSGAEGINIGDTVTSLTCVEPLEFVKVSEPTMEMTFSVNKSPFAGKEGKFVTSRHLRERLYKELLKDVSLRVSDGDTTESFKVAGRGEMHLSILIETMRREGYEMACSTPKVLFHEIDGKKCEPIERVIIDCPDIYNGAVMEKLGSRKGELVTMEPRGTSRTRLEYLVPTRCLFGYRSEFMTDTHGEGIINTIFDSYQPYKGDVTTRFTGSLVASEAGESTSYGIFNAQDRGQMFIGAQCPVYEGMIVGSNPKQGDIAVNVCKKKHLTAIRSAGADEALRLVTPKIMSLEEAIEYIADDELIEVTPKSLRLRKRILNTELRLKEEAKLKKQN